MQAFWSIDAHKDRRAKADKCGTPPHTEQKPTNTELTMKIVSENARFPRECTFVHLENVLFWQECALFHWKTLFEHLLLAASALPLPTSTLHGKSLFGP